ncbi:MAG: peptidase [Candidatus Latescibacterota bacterium]|jgi:hypothetical protein
MILRVRPAVAASLVLAVTAFACGPGSATSDDFEHIPAAQLEKDIGKYAQVKIPVDRAVLSAPEMDALKKLVQAGGVMDEVFLRQVWAGNVAMRDRLKEASAKGGEDGKLMGELYHYFRINFGPWDRLEEDAPFIGTLPKPPGANFYPEDLSAKQFEDWIAKHPDDAEAFKSYFTCIRRDGDKLKAVPYSDEYKPLLGKAAILMNEAADILTDPANQSQFRDGVDYTTLAAFLRSRAAAFGSNDYFQSDMDWMDVKDNIIDVTIGPYEVYEDNLFGYKAAFEAFIAVKHPEDSRQLADLKDFLPGMEMNLPILEEHKNPDRGTESPISVVDVVFVGGDSKAGVQTIAFNLPNDERVREAKGSKKVMLKNFNRAKFDKILVPIADTVLDPSQRDMIDFDIFFSNVLLHELSHGLGPGDITLPDGTETTVNQALKTLYSSMEEAKADIMGLYNTAYLVQQGYFPKEHEMKAYVNFLPGFFRAIRFGATSAHGKANMMEFNYMKEKGGIEYVAGSDRFRVNLDKMPGAVRSMTHDLCTIQATGDYAAAEAFIAKYGTMVPEVQKQLDKMGHIPTDIELVYEAGEFIQ